ncbi:hypothetical protein Tco_0553312 [Tanacetum coccineum]
MSNTNNNLQVKQSNAAFKLPSWIEGRKTNPPMLARNTPTSSNGTKNVLVADGRFEQYRSYPFALVDQQQQVYHPNQLHSKTNNRSQPAATRNSGKAIVNSPPPTYDQEHDMVAEDDEMSKEKEIDKLMALISLSFKKIYEPTNNNLRTASNTSRAIRYSEQADWKDDTDDEPDDQELEAHYMYMTQIQEVTSDPESVNEPYPIEKDQHNIIIDSFDMSYDREQDDQDDTGELAKERDLLASLIQSRS